jgi:hypothetical protein
MIPMSRISIMPALICVGWLLSSGLYPLSATAQPADAKAAAEQLYSQAQQLMAKGDYDAACPKFEASLELDAALGTVINLARCYEKQGRLASAWARYREAADLAARTSQGKRKRYATRQAEVLEARLPRLIIRVSSGHAISELSITRDGINIDPSIFDTAIYIDPGAHTVVARARGYLDFTKTFEATIGEEIVIEVPPLTPDATNTAENTDGANSSEQKATPSGDPSDAATDLTKPVGVRNSARSDGIRRGTQRTIGLITGGAGGLVLAGGLGFGWASRVAWSQAFDGGACQRETLECTVEGQRQADKARQRADIATVLSTGGAVLVVTGAVLYLTAREPTEGGARVAPMLAPDSMGVVMTGHF